MSNASTRGRQATTPLQIPAKGWKDIAWRTYQEIGNDRVMLVAAGITFYVLLAIVPMLAAMVTIYGLFFDPADIPGQVDQVEGVIPGGALDIVREQLTRLAGANESGLGLTLVISLGIALWSANGGMKAVFDGMNVAYDEREKRGFVELTVTSLGFTLGIIFSTFLVFALAFGLPTYLQDMGLGATGYWLGLIAGFLGVLLVFSLWVAAIYRWGPSRDNARWKWITPGAIGCVVVLGIATVGFSYYVANFGSYNATYGSLGGLIGFMTWIWISTIILLMGAEVNAEIEHQTRHDTTTGAHEPMGQRGARMADNIGRKWGEESANAGEPGVGSGHSGGGRSAGGGGNTSGQPARASRRKPAPKRGFSLEYMIAGVVVAAVMEIVRRPNGRG